MVAQCHTLLDGTSWHVADFSVSCDDQWHTAYTVFASFCIVGYMLGIPCFYASMLYRKRKELYVRRTASRGPPRRDTTLSVSLFFVSPSLCAAD